MGLGEGVDNVGDMGHPVGLGPSLHGAPIGDAQEEALGHFPAGVHRPQALLAVFHVEPEVPQVIVALLHDRYVGLGRHRTEDARSPKVWRHDLLSMSAA